MPFFNAPDGTKLYYSDEGTGIPLICLAGLTRNSTDFDFVAPHLSHMRLIRLDYRGRGRSDWADPATYTPLHEAGDVIALIDQLELPKAAVLGTSRGGLIAMTLAVMAKERLLGAALNDIGPEMNPAALENIGAYIGKKPAFKTHDALLPVWPDLIQGFENVPVSRMREEIARLFVQGSDGLELTYDPDLRISVMAALDGETPDLWPFFEALSGLPLCALRGANSGLLTPQTFEKMRARRPDMIAVEVEDRGHVPYLDEPEALDALTRWSAML